METHHISSHQSVAEKMILGSISRFYLAKAVSFS
jgi:hypothetical protein